MVEERSSDRLPFVSVTFPDGYQDNLVLSRFDANDEDRMANNEHCNYIGHLENEPEACVAMTGCSGSEDVHLTIISKHMQRSSMFTWKKDGSVEVIDKKNGLHGPRMKPLVKPRQGGVSVVQGDEVLLGAEQAALNNAEANCANSGSCSLPATQHIQLRVGYDDGMWNQFGQTASSVDAYINSIWAHLQTNYCHSTLDVLGLDFQVVEELLIWQLSVTKVMTNTKNLSIIMVKAIHQWVNFWLMRLVIIWECHMILM